MKVDITKREEFNEFLDRLTENTEAKWGVMRAQNMIEHLIKTLQFSNGKKQAAQKTTEQEAQQAKQSLIYTDMEMPMGLKSSIAGETADPFELPNLEEAKNQLNQELDNFEAYFASHPEATFVHPRLGSLTYQEWIILHNKHFSHHFKQFGLV